MWQKNNIKTNLTNPDKIRKEEIRQQLIIKKASIAADKLNKSRDSIKKIITKNNAKNISKELEDDKLAINNMLTKFHSIKTLEDVATTTRKLSNMDNVLKALCKLFLITMVMELKKHLYIEISQIKSIESLDEGTDKRALIKFRKEFSRIDEITFCFNSRKEYMMPFTTIYNIPHVLEDFQRQAVKAIDNDISVVIGAPTSSGKSLISQYLASKNRKTLVVLPTQELVDQYAGTVRNRKYKTLQHTPIMHLSGEQIYVDKDWVMLIGTPIDIWRYVNLQNSDKVDIIVNSNTFDNIGLPDNKQFEQSRTLDTRIFEYVIIDELQQMNRGVQDEDNAQAIAMERIAIYFSDKIFVILSATINNIDHVVKWLRYLKNDTKYRSIDEDTEPTVIGIVYNKRFINQEKKLLNNGRIEIISPLSALTVELINSQ